MVAFARPEVRFKHVDKFCLQHRIHAHAIYAALQYFQLSEEAQAQFQELYCPCIEDAKKGPLGLLVNVIQDLMMPPGVTHEFFLELVLRFVIVDVSLVPC